MKSIFLKQARRLGFDHQAYSQFTPTGEFLARMGFIVGLAEKMCS